MLETTISTQIIFGY